jgi:hypothetical protein
MSPDSNTALVEIIAQLAGPFAPEQVELKPGATTQDRTRALAMPYADPRAYQERLDAALGVGNWSTSYTLTPNGAVCRLTFHVGGQSYAFEDAGDWGENGNEATTAAMQAFKRTCAGALGLGRYLYSLPQVWADYDSNKKAFINPQGVIAHMYARASLMPITTAATHQQKAQTSATADNAPVATQPSQTAKPVRHPTTAPAATQAPASSAPTNLASDKQRGFIASLFDQLGWSAEQQAAYGQQRSVNLAQLTKQQASQIIEDLQQVSGASRREKPAAASADAPNLAPRLERARAALRDAEERTQTTPARRGPRRAA